MKKKILPGLMLLTLFFAFVSCQRNTKADLPENNGTKQTRIAPSQASEFAVSVIHSQLTVTVIKDKTVPVKGTLNVVGGKLDLASGIAGGVMPAATVVIDVNSWNSNLLERDERVKELFFHTDQTGFSTMTLTLDAFNPDQIRNLRAKNELKDQEVAAQLAFYGRTAVVTARTNLSFTPEGFLVARSVTPVTIRISDWGVRDNLKELTRVCMHDSIADEVAVDFEFTFKAVK